LPRIAEIDDDGNVRIRQRLSGTLAADLEFREFPFDTQVLHIEIISYRYSPDEIVFAADSLVAAAEKFGPEGWNLRILAPSFNLFEVPAINAKRPQIRVLLEAERKTRYYLLTMFLPMSLILFMSWTVFWLQPDIVPSRIAISTASIFSLIAFGFSIRLSLPKVSYVTRADLFVMGCTLLVFLALAVTVISSRWVNSDRMERALRANVLMRWTYVLLYVLVIVVALTV
jgi:gamma-aminobutyric acid receptor subunit beta